MKEFLGEVVFSVAGTTYLWEDVFVAAELWGDWGRLRRQVREELACLSQASEEDDPEVAEAIDAAAAEFRYERDLVAAEEMEAWLDRWGLSAESWMDYIRAAVLRERRSTELPNLVATYVSGDDEVDARMLTTAVCSGLFERVAHKLAGRAAIQEPADGSDSQSDIPRDLVDAGPQLPADMQSPGFLGMDVDIVRTKREHLAKLEQSYGRFCKTRVTPAALDAHIRSSHIDWTRLECQSVTFSDESAAREAALCVTTDGQPLDEVAREAHTTSRNESIYIEAIEPELQNRFLGAQKGDLIGPVTRQGRFVLYLVLDKVPPSISDAQIANRATSAIVDRLVDRAVGDRVKWHRDV
jgi:hypothetical protein